MNARPARFQRYRSRRCRLRANVSQKMGGKREDFLTGCSTVRRGLTLPRHSGQPCAGTALWNPLIFWDVNRDPPYYPNRPGLYQTLACTPDPQKGKKDYLRSPSKFSHSLSSFSISTRLRCISKRPFVRCWRHLPRHSRTPRRATTTAPVSTNGLLPPASLSHKW